jgi:hypothetical protein
MAEDFGSAIGLLEGIGLLEVILPFLLMFGLVYAILAKTRIAGDKADLNAVIALVVAFIVTLSSGFRIFVMAFIPHIAVFLVVMFVGMLVFLLYGGTADDFRNLLIQRRVLTIVIIVVILILVFMVISDVFEEEVRPIDPGDIESPEDLPLSGSESARVIFGNPRVVGAIALITLMTIATYAVIFQPK